MRKFKTCHFYLGILLSMHASSQDRSVVYSHWSPGSNCSFGASTTIDNLVHTTVLSQPQKVGSDVALASQEVTPGNTITKYSDHKL
jgi:hypothetical protein